MNVLDLNLVEKNNIGLSLSGGADSAVLAYILLKYSQRKIHFFTTASFNKNIITVKHSSSIIKKCIELTGNFNVEHHIDYVQVQDRTEFLNNLNTKVNSGIVDIMYTGTTSIPADASNFKNTLNNAIIQRRDPKLVKPLYSHNNNLYHPFINLDKKDIQQLYNDLNILTEIFPLTRSCESTVEFEKHCGHCWWCEERLWAFGTLV